MHKLNLFNIIKYWGQEQRLIYINPAEVHAEQPHRLEIAELAQLSDFTERKHQIDVTIGKALQFVEKIPMPAQTEQIRTIKGELTRLEQRVGSLTEQEMPEIIRQYQQLYDRLITPPEKGQQVPRKKLEEAVGRLRAAKADLEQFLAEAPEGLVSPQNKKRQEALVEIAERMISDFETNSIRSQPEAFLAEINEGIKGIRKTIETYRKESQKILIHTVKEEKLATAKSAIDAGWERSNSDHIDDYENITIGGGLGADEGGWHPFELGSRDYYTTRHLYSGILTGIRMGQGKQKGAEMAGGFARKTENEFRTEDILTEAMLVRQLQEAGVSTEMIGEFSQERPLLKLIQGYMLGLIYSAKKRFGDDTEKLNRYASALADARNAADDAIQATLRGASWDKWKPTKCKMALMIAVRELPTPEEWEFAQAPDDTSEDVPGAPREEEGPAPVPGQTGGGAEAARRPGPQGAPVEGGKKRGPEKIDSSTYAYNKKAIDKWKKVDPTKMESAIKQVLGYKADETVDYVAEPFAEAVRKFQISAGLDRQDGKIGPQTMTAIVRVAVDKKFLDKTTADYLGKEKGKIEVREKDYYFKGKGGRKGGTKGGKGETGGEGKQEREPEKKDPIKEHGEELFKEIDTVLEQNYKGKEIPTDKRKEIQGLLEQKILAFYKEKEPEVSEVIDKVEVTIGDVVDGKQQITIKIKMKGPAEPVSTLEYQRVLEKEEKKEEEKEKGPAGPVNAPQTKEGQEFARTIAGLIGTDRGKPNIEGSVEAVAGTITRQLSAYIVNKLRGKYDYFDYKGTAFGGAMQEHEKIAVAYLTSTLHSDPPLTPQQIGDGIARGFEDQISGGGNWMKSIESKLQDKKPKLQLAEVVTAIGGRMDEVDKGDKKVETLVQKINAYMGEDLQAAHVLTRGTPYTLTPSSSALVEAHFGGGDSAENKKTNIARVVLDELTAKKLEHPWV